MFERRALIVCVLLILMGCNEASPPDSSSLVGADTEPQVNPDLMLEEKAGAPLFTGFGDYHMKITTDDPGAQRYFDQGMVLAFAFNHAESVRSFRAAQKLDPSCAMCFWGEALATGPNINVTSNGKAIMSAADRASAHQAAQKALSLMGNTSALEQDYISAQVRLM